MEIVSNGNDVEKYSKIAFVIINPSQLAFTCSKLTTDTLGQGVKNAQS